MKNKILQSNNIFILPDQNKKNKITDNDIKKNQLRITVAFKKYFPDYNDILIFEHNKEIYSVTFTNKNAAYEEGQDRSHILKLGRTLMSKLNINTNSSVKITILGNKRYKIETI